MPQLDVGYYGSQIFWLVVSFSLIFAYCSYFFIPKTQGIYLKRRNFVDDYYSKASQAEEKAKNLIDLYEDHIKKAKTQSRLLLLNNIKEFEDKKRRHHDLLDVEMQEVVDETRQKLMKDQEYVLKASEPFVRESVQTLCQKIGVFVS